MSIRDLHYLGQKAVGPAAIFAVLLALVPLRAAVPPPTVDPANPEAPTAMVAEPRPGAPAATSPLLEDDSQLFKRGEFIFDLFGAAACLHSLEVRNNDGGGIGMGYFFSRYAAIYAEGQLIDTPDQDGSVMGGLMVRLPIDDMCFALYGFVEAGGTFGDRSTSVIEYGGGIDVRVTYHASVFFDARGVNAPKTSLDNTAILRFGLRLVF